MADHAERVLESMIPEMDLWIRKGVFTKEEVKEVARQRRRFELLMMRKIPKQIDFLRAIEFEWKLKEDFDRHWEVARTLLPKEDQKTTKHDFSILTRMHTLWKRTLQKFGDDIALWTKYFDFCEHVHSEHALSDALARALELHPEESSFWLRAASFAYDVNEDVVRARSLLESALHVHKQNAELWKALFSLECHYIASNWGDENNQVIAVPLKVLEYALAAFQQEDCPMLRRSFVALLQDAYPFSHSMRKVILGDILKEFPDHADSFRIAGEFLPPNNAIQLYMHALSTNAHLAARREILAAYVSFVQTVLSKPHDTTFEKEWQAVFQLKTLKSDLDVSVLGTLVECCIAGHLDKEAHRWIEYGLEHMKGAWQIAVLYFRYASLRRIPSDAVWSFVLEGIKKDRDLLYSEPFLTRCIERCCAMDDQMRHRIAKLVLEDTRLCHEHPLLYTAAVSLLLDASLLYTSSSLFDAVFAKLQTQPLHSVAAAKRLFSRVMMSEHNERAVQTVFDIHLALPDLKNNIDLWRVYIDYERSRGNAARASHILWRAKQAITDPTSVLELEQILSQ